MSGCAELRVKALLVCPKEYKLIKQSQMRGLPFFWRVFCAQRSPLKDIFFSSWENSSLWDHGIQEHRKIPVLAEGPTWLGSDMDCGAVAPSP